jgi:hypothetical protein
MTDSSPAENESGPPSASPKLADLASGKGQNSTAEDSTTATAADDAQAEYSDTLSENQKEPYSSAPVISASKRSRPPYKYDPKKITLRFLFANRDGLTVTVECNPTDTVGEVKGALLSVWPEGKMYSNFGTSLYSDPSHWNSHRLCASQIFRDVRVEIN